MNLKETQNQNKCKPENNSITKQICIQKKNKFQTITQNQNKYKTKTILKPQQRGKQKKNYFFPKTNFFTNTKPKRIQNQNK